MGRNFSTLVDIVFLNVALFLCFVINTISSRIRGRENFKNRKIREIIIERYYIHSLFILTEQIANNYK